MSKFKARFPIFSAKKDLVYLDSAATALKPAEMIQSQKEYYENYSANVHRGLYKISDQATISYEKAREKVASFINASNEEIIFTSGTTDGLNFLARSLRESKLITQSPEILLTELEHHSNIVPWQMLKPKSLKYISLDEKLELDLDKEYQADNVEIVSVSLVSNVTGHVANIKKIRQMFPKAYLIVDAAQAVAHLSIDVNDLGVDFLVFSSHKLYGPTGIGVIYGKLEHLEKLIPFRTGGGMIREVFRDRTSFGDLPERLEAGTPNIAGSIGLGTSIDFINKIGFKYIIDHEKVLIDYAIGKLSEFKDIKIFHSGVSVNKGKSIPTPTLEKEGIKSVGVISFTHEKIHAHDIAQFLGDREICLRAGHHCTQILHREFLKVPASARLSFGVYNDEKDIDLFIEALKECIQFYS